MSDDELSPDILDDDSDMLPGGYAKKDRIPKDEVGDVLDFISTEVGLAQSVLDMDELTKFSSGGSDEWEWEHYQLDYLRLYEKFIGNKGRRMGLSTGCAMKAFSRGILTRGEDYSAIFVSHNQNEAIRKVEYVKNFLYALPPRFRKEILRDPQQLIEWDNGDGTKSRIISHPQKPVRGGEGDIFLDEFAHYQYDKKIYDSAVHSTGMEGYTIDIISTPFGKQGLFYEIFNNPDRYPTYTRQHLKWWNCKRYLRKPEIEEHPDAFLAFAEKKCPLIDDLETRVRRFGNEKVIELYENSTKESFLQEMEGEFIDSEASYFGRDLIMGSSFPAAKFDHDLYDPKDSDFDSVEEALAEGPKWPIVKKYMDREYKDGTKIQFKTYDSLEELYSAVNRGEISSRLVAGADLGGRRHSTEIVVLEEIPFGDKTLQVERFNLGKRKWSLPDQKDYFEKILREGFIQKLRVDTTSIGQHIEDEMSKDWGERFEAVQMGGGSKQHDEMSNLKARFEEKRIAIAMRNKKLQSLMAIKREITDNKNISYKAPSTQEGHSDYAWALAFASLAGTPFGQRPINLNFTTFSEHDIKREDTAGVKNDFVHDFQENFSPEPGKGIEDIQDIGFKEKKSINEVYNPGEFNPNHES